MKTFKQFIQEGRSQAIDIADVKSIIHEFSEAIDIAKRHGPYVWRGIQTSNKNILIIDPSQFVRKSAYTTNYYTLLIDNLPVWKNFPERSKSLVATTDYNRADHYANSNYEDSAHTAPYVILPENNANFGVCPDFDIFQSFSMCKHKFEMNSMRDFNITIEELVNVASKTNEKEYDQNWQDLKNGLELLEQVVRKYPEEMNKRVSSSYANIHMWKYILNGIKSGKSVFDCISEILGPKENGFKTASYEQLNFNLGKEVWTSNKCLMVKDDYFNKFLQELQK